MGKKTEALKWNTFRDKNYSVYYSKDKNSVKKHLSKLLPKKEITKIEKYFTDYLYYLKENSDEQSRKILKKWEVELQDQYLWMIYIELLISPYRRMRKADDENIIKDFLKDRKLRGILIESVLDKLFYYSDLALAFVTGDEEKIIEMNKKLIDLTSKNKTLAENLSDEQNKRRKYPLELLKKIKEIETTKKPKPKQDQAIIEANRIVKTYGESELINEFGYPTNLLISIRDSYKSQKNSL